MRGQRLFVRPIEADDLAPVRDFLMAHGGHSSDAACGMLGKLVGELVAVVVMDVQGDSIRIEDVVVAKDLRRKRIGKYMLDEVSRLAAKLERGRVVVAPNPDREFFRRCGFDEDGEWMVRRVGP